MEIIVETYRPHGEPSSASLRVRPLPGQGVDTLLRVECSRSMRGQYPEGSFFRLIVKLIDRKGTPLLYSNYRDPWEQVTRREADQFIAQQFSIPCRR